MHAEAPQILNALRICDVPEVAGLLAPSEVTIWESEPHTAWNRTKAIYQAAGRADRFQRHRLP
jgi:hypothetical protein